MERPRRVGVAADPAPPAAGAGRWIGPVFAVVGTLAFSFKAILVKLAYAWDPVDATTLLTLRMLYAAPFFAAMAWASRDAAPMSRGDVLRLLWLGFIGYYLASYLDFLGLQFITAALERLVLYLYPTIVLILSALLYKRPIRRREVTALALSYAGIVIVFWNDLRLSEDPRAIALGTSLIFACAICHAIYMVGSAGVIGRLGSMRFIAWAMLVSTAFVLAQFVVTKPLSALAVPLRIHALMLGMAIVATVLPTWMMAEAIRRIGANHTSLVGSLGPVFTIGLGAMILGEAVHAIQLAGAALVLAGVLLVSLKRAPKASSAQG
jgi:drug/metabolite transporter (DMT)-like permease